MDESGHVDKITYACMLKHLEKLGSSLYNMGSYTWGVSIYSLIIKTLFVEGISIYKMR